MKGLTKKQTYLLNYIKVYRKLHGRSPSLRGMQSWLGLSSHTTVREHLGSLVEKGYLVKTIDKSRNYVPTNKEVTP